MSKYKEAVKMVQGLAYLTQVGLSIALPIIGFLWLAGWLSDRFSIGQWIIIPALILGLGSGFCSLLSFTKIMNSKRENDDK